MDVSIIIPAYNEGERIKDTLTSLKNYSDDIIVVDDASIDQTAQIAEQMNVSVVRQPFNQGYIAAIKTGFKKAQKSISVTFDADGEFPVSILPLLIQPIIDNQADMVQGNRDMVPRPSERLLTYLAGKKCFVGDSGTGLRAIKTELAQKLELRGNCICGVFSLEVCNKGGIIKEIPVELVQIEKTRKIAWYHFGQFFYVLKWLFK